MKISLSLSKLWHFLVKSKCVAANIDQYANGRQVMALWKQGWKQFTQRRKSSLHMQRVPWHGIHSNETCSSTTLGTQFAKYIIFLWKISRVNEKSRAYWSSWLIDNHVSVSNDTSIAKLSTSLILTIGLISCFPTKTNNSHASAFAPMSYMNTIIPFLMIWFSGYM